MTMSDANPRAVAGDNQAPAYAQRVTDQMRSDYAEFERNVAAILEKARTTIPAEVASDDELALVTKAVVDMRDTKGRAIAFHKKEKEPFLRGGEAVDQFFFGFRDRLDKAMKVIGGRGDAYNQKKLAAERLRREAEAREAARLAREAQERLEAEQRAAREAEERAARARKPENIDAHTAVADQHAANAAGAKQEFSAAVAEAQDAATAAAAKAADIARQRTEDGYLSTMKQVPYVEIVDASKLDKDLLWPFMREDAILSALKAYAKTTNHKRKMDGAIIEMRDSTVYR